VILVVMLFASLAGASLASGGGPRRRDTADAAFGPAPAAFGYGPALACERLITAWSR